MKQKSIMNFTVPKKPAASRINSSVCCTVDVNNVNNNSNCTGIIPIHRLLYDKQSARRVEVAVFSTYAEVSSGDYKVRPISQGQ